MAKKILTNLDLSLNEIQNIVIHNLATSSAPAGKSGQIYFDTTEKLLKVYNGTAWTEVGAGVESIAAKDNDNIVSVDSTDAKNPKIGVNISATQGDSVTLTRESDGLKVAVADGNTSGKGLVQLSSTPSATVENVAATPKGANVQVAELTGDSLPTGDAYAYKLTQGGTDISTKVELKKATTSVVGMTQLSSTVSDSAEDVAATPKGAHVTLTKQATAESGYAATYVFAQGGTELATKINIPLDYLVKKAEVKVCTVQDQPVEGLEVGDKYIDFTVNAKEGTGTESHMYIPVKDIAKAYTAGDGVTISSENVIAVNAGNGLAINSTSKAVEVAVEKGLSIDATSKKVGITNAITAQATSAVYPVTLTEQGLVASYGSAVKTAKIAAGTIAVGATSANVALPAGSQYMGAFAVDASTGEEVELDKVVTAATASAAGSVVFTIAAAYTNAITVTVVYRDVTVEA